MTETYFSTKSFALMREFARNNNREWFAANKTRFEEMLRDPFLRLIGDLAVPLAKISPHFRADPRTQGGSMFRASPASPTRSQHVRMVSRRRPCPKLGWRRSGLGIRASSSVNAWSSAAVTKWL